MDLRQLTTFRTVVELGSLSKASDRLRVAQPALSRQIRLLEHDLKTPLFVRHGRGMVPTEAGRLLFERTAGVMRRLEQAREDVLAASGTPSGRVTLGLVPTLASTLAATVAKRVVERFPDIQLRVIDAYGGFLVDWLHRGEIDLAVVYGPAANLHLGVERLREDRLFAVGAKGSGLAGRESVPLAWMTTQPLVLPSHPHGLRALVDAACGRAGLDLVVRVEADSFRALVDIVAAGVGITFLPWPAVARQVEQGLLEAAPISEGLSRELVLALPLGQAPSGATRAVADIVREETKRPA